MNQSRVDKILEIFRDIYVILLMTSRKFSTQSRCSKIYYEAIALICVFCHHHQHCMQYIVGVIKSLREERGDFEVFHPQGRFIDQLLHDKFHPHWSRGVRVWSPKAENFTKFYYISASKCPQRCILHMIFTKLSGHVGCFTRSAMY